VVNTVGKWPSKSKIGHPWFSVRNCQAGQTLFYNILASANIRKAIQGLLFYSRGLLTPIRKLLSLAFFHFFGVNFCFLEFLRNRQQQTVGMSRVGTLGFAVGFSFYRRLGWQRAPGPCRVPTHPRTGWFSQRGS